MLKEKPIEEKIQEDDNAKFEGYFNIKFCLPEYSLEGTKEGLGMPESEFGSSISLASMRKMIDLTNLYQ